MAIQQYTVAETLTAMPARVFLQKHLGISQNLWRKIKNSDSFTVNGQKVIAALTEVKPGDIISFATKDNETFAAQPLPLDIRYEDNYFLIINKPPNQLVHPTTKEHEGTVANAVLYHYQQTGQPHAFHPLHRLDRKTSGLVIIAKIPQVQFLLSKKQKDEQVKFFSREYLAVLEGIISPSKGEINLPIGRKPDSMIERMVTAEGKEAVTLYETIAQSPGSQPPLSLIKVKLLTGRTHQIRVHFSHLGHPLLGDDLYGGSTNLLSRQGLHAYKVSFEHPFTKEKITVTAPPPADLQELIDTYLSQSQISNL